MIFFLLLCTAILRCITAVPHNKQMAIERFILTDQTKNRYGFVLLTSGCNQEWFEKNPVMLHNHNPNQAIGTWTDVKTEGMAITALPVFCEGDEEANKYKNKVDKGVIRACSVGFEPKKVVYGYEGFPDCPVVTEWDLIECSITPMPANGNALKLYKDGEQLKLNDTEIKDYLVKLSLPGDAPNNQPTKTMNKEKLIMLAGLLGLAADASEDSVIAAVKKMIEDKVASETKLATLSADLKKKEVEMLVDAAITSKKLKAEQRESFIELGAGNIDSLKKVLDNMPVPHTSVTSQLNKEAEVKSAHDGKTFKELMKSESGSAYLADKKKNDWPEYARLFKESYNVEPKK
jgi:HK97 family phage prohead protease